MKDCCEHGNEHFVSIKGGSRGTLLNGDYIYIYIYNSFISSVKDSEFGPANTGVINSTNDIIITFTTI
jgi:hypothetical protein